MGATISPESIRTACRCPGPAVRHWEFTWTRRGQGFWPERGAGNGGLLLLGIALFQRVSSLSLSDYFFINKTRTFCINTAWAQDAELGSTSCDSSFSRCKYSYRSCSLERYSGCQELNTPLRQALRPPPWGSPLTYTRRGE